MSNDKPLATSKKKLNKIDVPDFLEHVKGKSIFAHHPYENDFTANGQEQ